MNFSEAENYLFSLGNEIETMKLGLKNIRTLLAALGRPHEKYLKVQVAGTNGKGSVCAFLRSICLEAGITAGVFTSPHLISITERINIGGVDIGDADFARYSTQVRTTAEKLVVDGELDSVPTFFEQVTAVALLAFANANVDIAILETGLGGRFDAVTAANAEMAAITRIDYDHQEYLGETIEKIAAEKAAIIRSDTEAVVVGPQLPTVLAVIHERLRETGGGNPTRREGAQDEAEPRCANAPPPALTSLLGLRGHHQVENAQIAAALADKLRSRFAISDDDIIAGLENATHAGRLEYVDKNFLLDGAHNVGGARALVRYLDEFESRPITLVFAAMNDKKVHEIMKILFPRVGQIVFTRTSNERGMHLRDLLEEVPRQFADRYIHLVEPVTDAIHMARDISTADSLILVTGSLYLIGEVKRILQSEI